MYLSGISSSVKYFLIFTLISSIYFVESKFYSNIFIPIILTYLFLSVILSDRNFNANIIIKLFVTISFLFNFLFFVFYFFSDQNNLNYTNYFKFIQYNEMNEILLANLIFIFLFIVSFNFFPLKEFSTKKIDLAKYPLLNLILIFFIFVILQFLNKFFINSKILFFILGDSIRLISLFIIIIFSLNYLNKISKQYLFLIFILALFLIHEISILDNKIIQIDRGYYFIYIFSTFTCLLSLSNINFNIFKKFIFISFIFAVLLPIFLLTQPLEYFHLFSETQINRNLSIIIYWIKNSSMSFEKIDYLSKLFYDILPFTGQERGYNYLMVNLYLLSGFDPGDTRYNFGILSEGYLFYGYIDCAFIISYFFIYYIIHKIFYRLKDDIFFYFCFFHLMSQTYWLYRGGLSLYLRKLYYFSFIYLFVFLSALLIFLILKKK